MSPPESLQSTAEALVRRGRALSRELEALERTVARSVGLTPAEAHALGQLLELGTLPMNDLARGLRIRRSTATRLVDQLQRKGWARRLSGSEDRRQVLLEILPTGRERVLAFEEILLQVENADVLARLDEALRRWNDQHLE